MFAFTLFRSVLMDCCIIHAIYFAVIVAILLINFIIVTSSKTYINWFRYLLVSIHIVLYGTRWTKEIFITVIEGIVRSRSISVYGGFSSIQPEIIRDCTASFADTIQAEIVYGSLSFYICNLHVLLLRHILQATHNILWYMICLLFASK